MTTLRKQLTDAGLDWDKLQSIQISREAPYLDEDYPRENMTDDELLDLPFHSGYGSPEGPSVLAYTEDEVYFSVQYDGAEWIDSVPRNPDPDYTPVHYGGG